MTFGFRTGSMALAVVLLMMAFVGHAVQAREGIRASAIPVGVVRAASPGPMILNTTPWDGQLLGLKSPAVIVAYTGLGVPIAGVDFHLDGMNLTSAGAFNDTAFVLPLALELRDGPHLANFTVVDALGMASFANWTFIVDTIPPILFVTSPAYPVVPSPAISVAGTAQVVFPIAAPVTVTVTVLPSQTILTTTAAADGSFALLAPLSEGANILFINGTDRAGNLASEVKTVIRDTVGPPLTVVSPPNLTVTPSNIVRIAGRTEFGAYVTVNGYAVVVYPDGTFSVDLALADGIQIVAVAAADQVGNANYTVRVVVVDSDVPRITLSSPSASVTTSGTVVVSGHVEDSNLVLVRVNGLDATLDPATGAFSRTLNLPDGTNPIVVVAVDAAQRVVFANTSIVVDTAPPVVRVTAPLDGLETNQSTVVIQGVVDDRNATVLVNGQQIRPDADGSWRTTVALVAGENRIGVDAVDAAGNRGATVVKVVTYVSPWPSLGDRISAIDRAFSVWGSTLSLALGAGFLLLLTLLFATYMRANNRIVRLRGLRPASPPEASAGKEMAEPAPESAQRKPPK